ncbi:MAG: MotA/TolQ/ExbB proton channel family protein [Proteobacteria bacterium]|nr:MotA/TolQ/ExbB proton channel family protein [Pseudomonadota bacterium]MBU1713243.1 MotA/TolQ/ExbB proton channel family protein [Pseudomonadota bacterium]
MMDLFLKGGPVMYPLLACSIIAMTVVIERAIFWIQSDRFRNQALVDEVLELCRVGNWDTVRVKVAGSKDYLIRILVGGIVHREFSMTKAMESAASDEIRNMRRYMGILDTMITVAPLMGFLGTVTGIILSFESLGKNVIEHPEMVAVGIAQALITTAAGLIIAILTVFPYNYFNSRIEDAALSIDKYATSLEIVYKKLVQNTDNNEEAEE